MFFNPSDTTVYIPRYTHTFACTVMSSIVRERHACFEKVSEFAIHGNPNDNRGEWNVIEYLGEMSCGQRDARTCYVYFRKRALFTSLHTRRTQTLKTELRSINV